MTVYAIISNGKFVAAFDDKGTCKAFCLRVGIKDYSIETKKLG
jgi:hypothetical protein